MLPLNYLVGTEGANFVRSSFIGMGFCNKSYFLYTKTIITKYDFNYRVPDAVTELGTGRRAEKRSCNQHDLQLRRVRSRSNGGNWDLFGLLFQVLIGYLQAWWCESLLGLRMPQLRLQKKDDQL